jgi:hypothetical protein
VNNKSGLTGACWPENMIDMQKSAKTLIGRLIHLVCTLGVIASLAVIDARAEDDRLKQNTGPRLREESASSFQLLGPSIHFGMGARFRKAPNLDTYDSPVGALRFSALSLQFSDEAYVAFLAPGVSYVGDLRFAFMLSPFILSHISGVGIGLDFFGVRADRLGGPYSVTLNFDVLGIVRFVSSRMN